MPPKLVVTPAIETLDEFLRRMHGNKPAPPAPPEQEAQQEDPQDPQQQQEEEETQAPTAASAGLRPHVGAVCNLAMTLLMFGYLICAVVAVEWPGRIERSPQNMSFLLTVIAVAAAKAPRWLAPTLVVLHVAYLLRGPYGACDVKTMKYDYYMGSDATSCCCIGAPQPGAGSGSGNGTGLVVTAGHRGPVARWWGA